jgi:hypothetical protein
VPASPGKVGGQECLPVKPIRCVGAACDGGYGGTLGRRALSLRVKPPRRAPAPGMSGGG